MRGARIPNRHETTLLTDAEPPPCRQGVLLRSTFVESRSTTLRLRTLLRRSAHLSLANSGGYISTPNVDHIIRARRDPSFRAPSSERGFACRMGWDRLWSAHPRYTSRENSHRPLPPEAVARRTAERRPRTALFGGPPGAAEAAGDAWPRGARRVEARSDHPCASSSARTRIKRRSNGSDGPNRISSGSDSAHQSRSCG